MQNCCQPSGWMKTLDYSGVDHLPLAMAYVPVQTFQKTFDRKTALQHGTVFPELCKPFCGRGGAWR